MKVSTYLAFLILTVLVSACQHRRIQPQAFDTPTAGHIHIVVDESLKPLIQAQIEAFQAIYQQAEIEASYVPEAVAIQSFLQGSARLVILGRNLWPAEASILDAQKIVPDEVKAAIDGIALILNRENPDSLLTYQQIVDVLQGKVQHWPQINKFTALDKMQVVFDHTQSGIIQWMMDSVASVDALPPYCFAVDNNEEVIRYVSQTPQAIGVIGLSWVSDQDDSTSHRFLQQIRVAGITSRYDTTLLAYYQPYQAYLAQKKYPLIRDIYIISREARTGLGSSFMAFVCGDKGQRIVLKSGLVPATMPIRIVEFVSDQN